MSRFHLLLPALLVLGSFAPAAQAESNTSVKTYVVQVQFLVWDIQYWDTYSEFTTTSANEAQKVAEYYELAIEYEIDVFEPGHGGIPVDVRIRVTNSVPFPWRP